jgi:hypothetical protein
LSLSALDVEKTIREGYADALLDVYNFFDTKLKQIDITLDKNTFGSTEALKDVFENIMSSGEVPVALKGHIHTLRLFLRNKELPPAPAKTAAASPTIPAMPKETDLRTSNYRLVMVPFHFDAIKRAELTNTLNRVVSYLNKLPGEILFFDDYFDSKNPLLPFLILLTSPTAEDKVKEDVRALLPHLKTALSTVYLAASDGNDILDMGVRALKDHEENRDAQNPSEPPTSLKYYGPNEIYLDNGSASQNVSGDNSIAEAPESESVLQRGSFGDDNSIWPFDISKLSQQVVADKLKEGFVVLQKRFFNAMSAIQENFQYTRDVMKQLFNKFLSSATSDSGLKEKLTALLHYSSNLKESRLGKESTRESVQEISQKMKRGMIEIVQNICSSYKKNWRDPVRMEKTAVELMKHLKWPIESDDQLERDIRSLLTENCDVHTSTVLTLSKSSKPLDIQRILEINKLLIEYDLQGSENSTFTPRFPSGGNQELEEDIEYLVNKYGLSSARLSQPGSSTPYSNVSEDVKSLLNRLNVSGNLIQAKNSHVTIVMLPISAVGTENEPTFEEKLKEDIRNIVRKYSYKSTTNMKGFRKHIIPDMSEMLEEIKQLPLDLTELTNAGCYDNLLRLYDYLRTHSYSTVILTSKNATERSHFMRDIIDELRSTDFDSEEVKRDATCVSPYITDGNLKNRTIVSTSASPAQKTEVPTTTPLNAHAPMALWPIYIPRIVSDDHEGSLQRIYEHLHSHYQDLLISTEKSEVQRNRILREVLESIIYSDAFKEELKSDAKVILSYMTPINTQSSGMSTNAANTRDRFTNTRVKENEMLYPLNLSSIISKGLYPNLKRVLTLCKNNSCEEILEPVRNTPGEGDMFRQLLEILKSFSDTDDELKEDISAIIPFVLDTRLDNAMHQELGRSEGFPRDGSM